MYSKIRRSPRERAAFPTELPTGSHVPEGVPPETYASKREMLTILTLRFMTSRLRAMYQAYDGDLLLCLVLGEVASRNKENFYNSHSGKVNFFDKRLRPANALSISEVTGIPRETVRRKLAKLINLGWVEKTPRDQYVITDKIGGVFAAFDDCQSADLLNTSLMIRQTLGMVR